MADVLAVASTGQIAAALLAADLRRLDSDTVQELAAFGVAVVAVHRADDSRTPVLLERIGVAAAVADDAPAAAMVRAVQDAVADTRGRATGATVVGSDPAYALAGPPRDGRVSMAPPFVPGPAPDASVQPDAGARGGVIDGDVPAASTRPEPGSRRRSGRRLHRTVAARPAHAARGGRGAHDDATFSDAAGRRTPTGRVIAVWGPTGAPGRSTVAMGLADRVVAAGSSALLIDADVYGGVLASAFGLLDESAGLAGACRLASNGRLGAADFAGLCWQVQDRLTLMTGIARADRWPELRPSAIPMVLDMARAFADVVIVDCSSVVETDEEITFDTLAPRRNGATLAVLDAADTVVAVGAADPAGMERLARGYADLTAAVAGLQPKIVFNRVRATAASQSELREASRRFCGCDPVGFLPEDRTLVDLAWRRGVTLSTVTSKSPLISAFDTLTQTLADAPLGR
jgi:MinD-like ATPase involved in chromosome partitioning or flagellar assembly